MGLKDPHDPRRFEHLAKVNADGVVVAMVEVDAASDWEHWTDGDGHRYVYLTDLIPIDLHGEQILSARVVTAAAKPRTRPAATKKLNSRRRGR